MRENALKNRSARERYRRNQEEAKQIQAEQARRDKENISTMWVIAIAMTILVVGTVALNLTHGYELFDIIAQLAIGVILIAYAIFGLVICNKHHVSGIINQLDIILIDALLFIGSALYMLLR